MIISYCAWSLVKIKLAMHFQCSWHAETFGLFWNVYQSLILFSKKLYIDQQAEWLRESCSGGQRAVWGQLHALVQLHRLLWADLPEQTARPDGSVPMVTAIKCLDATRLVRMPLAYKAGSVLEGWGCTELMGTSRLKVGRMHRCSGEPAAGPWPWPGGSSWLAPGFQGNAPPRCTAQAVSDCRDQPPVSFPSGKGCSPGESEVGLEYDRRSSQDGWGL